MEDTNQNNELKKLELLKDILFQEELVELKQLKNIVDSPEKLAQRVSPIVESKIANIKDNFPEEFGKVVDLEIAKKLQNSQQELVDILTPYFGKLIGQYVKYSIAELQKNIQESIDEKLSFLNFFKKSKKKNQPKLYTLNEVLLIEHGSGILLAEAAKEQKLDRDVVAGMLTAIKSFVEDAYDSGGQNLESLEYGDYTLFLHSLTNRYFVFAGFGYLDGAQKNSFQEKVFHFIDRNRDLLNSDLSDNSKKLSKQLKGYFFH